MTHDAIFAVDPGTEDSGFALVQRAPADGLPVVLDSGRVTNDTLLRALSQMAFRTDTLLAVEQLEGMGMPASRELLETAVWSGRFIQVWTPAPYVRVARRWVKLHLCGVPQAKDPNIRAAILDRFGGAGARGVKAAPGPLYGVRADAWAAVAVALTYLESGYTFGPNGKVKVTVDDLADDARAPGAVVEPPADDLGDDDPACDSPRA